MWRRKTKEPPVYFLLLPKVPADLNTLPSFQTPPHCDSSVLHEPNSCTVCDRFPHWQQYRILARIAFTNSGEPDMAPCPSEWFRSPKQREAWSGNRVHPYEEAVAKQIVETKKRLGELEL
jgi:hypothetical protein